MGNDLRHIVAVGAACLCWLAAGLSASPAAAGPNRWTAIGPDGASVVALAIDPRTPTTAFAGTLGSGVLKTVDGGGSWATVNGGLPATDVLALAIDPSNPSTLYAGTNGGVFKSTDGAQSWFGANVGLVDGYVAGFAIDPKSPATVYVGTASGVFKSTNGAATWTSINAGLEGLYPRAIAIDPVSPSVIYVSADLFMDDFDGTGYGTVFRSVDAGASWTAIYGSFRSDNLVYFPSVVAIAVDPHSPSRLYLALSFGGVVRSVDGGASWSHVDPPAADVASLGFDPANPLTLYVGTYSGSAYRTIDAGDHWTGVRIASDRFSVFAVAETAPPTVYAGGDGGLFRSMDSGQTWMRLALGVRKIGVYPLAVDPTASSTIYTARGIDLVSKTTDGGAHWADIRLGFTGETVKRLAVDPASPSTLYAVVGTNFLYKSGDAGVHWAPISFGPPNYVIGVLAVAPSSSSTLYVGTTLGGVFKSVNGGFSWTPVNDGLGAAINVCCLAVDPLNADIVYVSTSLSNNNGGGFFKSTNGAAQWRQISLPRGTYIGTVVIDPTTPTTLYAPQVYGVSRSTDGGETWTAPQSPLPGISALVIDPHSPSQIYATTWNGVYRSTDAAASWTPMNSGLPTPYISNLSIDRTGSLLRAATAAGLFEYRISGPPVAATVPVIEYVHSGFGHYFITSSPDEIAKLDNGTFVGWSRTGSEFNAFSTPNANSAPVCRFFSTAFGLKSSHFYTPFAAECATRRADASWLLESADAFDIAVPASDGSCAAGFAPVYRLYNNGQGGAPNHRYTTDFIVRAQMIAQGWMPEGLGPDAVQMCSPP